MCTALNGITYKKRILPSRWPNKKDHNLFARNFQAQPASKRFRARPDAMPNATKNRAMTGEPQLEKEGAREIERYTPIYHTLKLEISLTTTSLGATSGHDGVGSDAWSSLLAVFFLSFCFLLALTACQENDRQLYRLCKYGVVVLEAVSRNVYFFHQPNQCAMFLQPAGDRLGWLYKR